MRRRPLRPHAASSGAVGLLGLGAMALVLGCGEASAPRRAERIVCLGDSITAGFTRARRQDPEGGYPGRLQRRLGPGVRIVNRGLGGAKTRTWLTEPTGPEGRIVWQTMRRTWPDLASIDPASADSVLLATLAADRPDVVIVLLGINDLLLELPYFPTRPEKLIAQVTERLATIRRQASTVAPVVLLATVLPSPKAPPGTVEALNARLRALAADVLPLGERFAAAGGELLSDGLHPSPAGHEVLAELVEDELAGRGLIARPGA